MASQMIIFNWENVCILNWEMCIIKMSIDCAIVPRNAKIYDNIIFINFMEKFHSTFDKNSDLSGKPFPW